MFRKFIKFTAPVAVLVFGVGVVQAMIAAKPEPEKKEESQRLVSLYVDEVQLESVVLSVDTHGEARSKTEIDLVPDVSGRIVAVSNAFAEGAAFDRDTVLVKIDDASYRVAVAQAEARVAEAERNLATELGAAGIKRKQWESTRQGQTPTPLQVNEPQVAEAKAKLAAAQADLDMARLNLARTEIKVPFEGRVMRRTVGVGQFVTMGQSLGRVFATETVEVTLPLTDAQLVELGLPIGFEAGAEGGPEVTLSAAIGGTEQRWTGRIVRTHAAIDQDTRLVHAVAEVQDPYGDAASNGMPLAVGLFVTAEIAGTDARQAMVVPRDALRNSDKVYVVNAEDRLEIRTVDVLSTSEERVLITGGLDLGERVVTSTLPNAADGMLVQPILRGEQPEEALTAQL